MTGNVAVCLGQWQVMGPPGNQRPFCVGTIQSVPANELNPSGLSAEDLSEYIGHVMILFAIVFGFLAIKKAIF